MKNRKEKNRVILKEIEIKRLRGKGKDAKEGEVKKRTSKQNDFIKRKLEGLGYETPLKLKNVIVEFTSFK